MSQQINVLPKESIITILRRPTKQDLSPLKKMTKHDWNFSFAKVKK